MRLGQLARKLAIKPSEIKEYLEKQGTPFEGTSNHKIPDEYVDDITAQFAPEITERDVEEDITNSAKKEVSTIPELAEDTPDSEHQTPELTEDIITEGAAETEVEEAVKVEEEITEDVQAEIEEKIEQDKEEDSGSKEVVLTVQEILSEEEVDKEENTEEKANELEGTAKVLIKAPKVSLPGLKVVGKIDLPEPIQKEEAIEDEQTSEAEKAEDVQKRKSSTKRPYQRKSGRGQKRNKRGPLTLEEKRDRERRSTERKKKAEEKKKKSQKKQHYLSQVKNVQPAKPKKSKKEKLVTEKVDKRPPPKTIVGKFWRWLNT